MLRNIIIFVGFAIFVLWYGGTWFYRTQYKEPREAFQKEIDQYKAVNTQMQTGIQNMRTFVGNNQTYYYRSFPKQTNAVRTLYQSWLSDLATFCEMEDTQIDTYDPRRTNWCYDYRFQLRGRISSEKYAQLLYEFYWAPYLHRIVSMTLNPVERSEMMTIDLVLEGVALYPTDPQMNQYYPLADQLPQSYFQRLSSPLLTAYQSVAERNLLHYAKSGVDRADHTYLTFIGFDNDEPELWLTDRTSRSEEPIVVKLNQAIRIGSFIATFIETDGEYAVFDRNGQLWLLDAGDCLNEAYAIPPEAR